ncbi:hypothetical protein ESZ50_04885 [Weissella muntiaci]|uniref:Uncharacterized protein n=1 Tax=Weissella muntiaci TaxID=2508881 RepID=A0A6C2C7H5_9LACO|nr:hypothetical protein [Weissella muntiaci]TYC49928.1 hypothetical protein ESZ50_04885 [Weissella muntiaci]
MSKSVRAIQFADNYVIVNKTGEFYMSNGKFMPLGHGAAITFGVWAEASSAARKLEKQLKKNRIKS